MPESPLGPQFAGEHGEVGERAAIAEFVSIPDDVVFCLEIENLSFSSVLARLVSRQPWLTELAPKLVTREDIAWPELTRTAELGRLIERGNDL